MNNKFKKARMSKGWSHNSNHFHFARTLPGAKFEEPRTVLGDKVILVACILIALLFLAGVLP